MGLANGFGLALCAGLTLTAGAQAQNAPLDAIPPVPAAVDASAVVARVSSDARIDADPSEIIVYGRAIKLIGVAQSSSQGTVGYADFKNRPLSRVGELVENVPGLIATQHSGSGKANQYFLRGFNLDHGTDLAGFIDGTPINLRTHGHGQGWLDLNFIIPELIEKIDFRKGPYFADVGDFSAAGTVKFKTADRLAHPIAEVEIGSFDHYRALVAGSVKLGESDLLVGVDGTKSHGSYDQDEHLGRIKGLVKYSQGTPDHGFDISFNGYRSTWHSTDQIPQRAIDQGIIDRFGNIDHTLGGETTRLSLASEIHLGRTDANFYATYQNFRINSNFTYFLDDPVNGDEFQQRDRRGVFGGAVRHTIPTTMLGKPVTFRFGAESRYDRIANVGLYQIKQGVRVRTIRQDVVDELSGALSGEAEIALTPRLRATVGGRGDYFGFDVCSDNPLNSGHGHALIGEPKVAIAWHALDHLEFYANYGQSYHSNDVRGAVITVDPKFGGPADKVTTLSRAVGYEGGARLEFENVNATVTVYDLTLDSELVFSGDVGATTPQGATERYGVESSLFWRPRQWLTLDGTAAFTHARFTNAPGRDRIPNSADEVIAGGMTAAVTRDIALTARVRHFGPEPLIQDNSRHSPPTTIVNAGAYWQLAHLKLSFDVLNVLDARATDITYFYTSRLPGEPLAGVDDYHLHPIEKRQFRGSVSYAF